VPELPEVETVKRTLEKLVVGKTIDSVEVRWPKIIKQPDDVRQFQHLISGQTIKRMDRRGKFLKFILDEYVLVSHLRMEGRYIVTSDTEPYDKHTHVFFTFTDNTQLRYRDVRKFGTMHLFPKGEEEEHLPLSQLGCEPLSEAFSPSVLIERFKTSKRKVKVALLDQTVVVGLGNIYVDEALFRANLHPEKLVHMITHAEIDRLHRAIVQTLQEAVEQGGSTIRSYVNSQGEIGMFQQQLFVYARKEAPCKTCGNLVEKIVVGGRGTHFCPNCQPQYDA
jgi:formamidopyrimidine-DNA glycosylase